MYGLDWNDPLRIRSWQELVNWINEIGFLPLFRNEIEGFSAEEHTADACWWTENPEHAGCACGLRAHHGRTVADGWQVLQAVFSGRWQTPGLIEEKAEIVHVGREHIAISLHEERHGYMMILSGSRIWCGHTKHRIDKKCRLDAFADRRSAAFPDAVSSHIIVSNGRSAHTGWKSQRLSGNPP